MINNEVEEQIKEQRQWITDYNETKFFVSYFKITSSFEIQHSVFDIKITLHLLPLSFRLFYPTTALSHVWAIRASPATLGCTPSILQ